MKTILVPTDFSEAATNAAEYAAKFAKSVNAQVLLFHAYHVRVTTTAEFPLMPLALDEMQAENEEYIKREAAHLSKRTGATVIYQAKMGLAADEIREVKNVDLIIMGMKGSGKIAEALLGSIAASVFRKSIVPVLLIPEKAGYKKPKTIVFACDRDPATDVHSLDVIKSFSKAFDPKIYVVNIKRKKESVAIKQQVATKLDGLLNNVEHVYYFPEREDLAEGINEFASEHDADIVAVVPHRYDLVNSLFHKSISKKLAFHTNVPLLALPDNHKSIAAYFL
ncbi:MAG: universal stress protein [Bacteroidota bacterium]|jgi:nucleotide-binding universal stress UspA family protein|nr:universal stress protein [Bacteroidota bacterium]